MKYKIEVKINDGKNEAPPVEVIVNEHNWELLLDRIADEMTNDYGDPFGVGATLLIERVA
jgi:hypothetical protein